MSMTDPVGDMLTRLRNAILARKAEVSVPSSRLKERIAEILHEEGYLDGVSKEESPARNLIMKLRYGQSGRQNAIQELHRISKPGQRKYVGTQNVPRVRFGLGIAIVSTSQGLMTDRQARKLGIGGEILCEVW